jgi:hypothetical protein
VPRTQLHWRFVTAGEIAAEVGWAGGAGEEVLRTRVDVTKAPLERSATQRRCAREQIALANDVGPVVGDVHRHGAEPVDQRGVGRTSLLHLALRGRELGPDERLVRPGPSLERAERVKEPFRVA